MSHINRRHPGMNIPPPPVASQPLKASSQEAPGQSQAILEKVTATIETFSQKMLDTERQLRNEMETKLEKEMKLRNVCTLLPSYTLRKCWKRHIERSSFVIIWKFKSSRYTASKIVLISRAQFIASWIGKDRICLIKKQN